MNFKTGRKGWNGNTYNVTLDVPEGEFDLNIQANGEAGAKYGALAHLRAFNPDVDWDTDDMTVTFMYSEPVEES